MNYTEDQMTGWYNLSEQNPWEPGVYEVPCRFGGEGMTYFSWWDGLRFRGGWDSPEEAFSNKDHEYLTDYKKWRGLNHNPLAPSQRARGISARRCMW